MADGLKAGVSKVNITPPIGCDLTGFGGREYPALDISDDLFAKALVLDDGAAKIAIVTTDLLGLDFDLVEEIREAVEKHTGIPGANVMLPSSHTHSGPATISIGLGDRDEHCAQVTKMKMIGAVRTACAAMKPAKVGCTREEVRCGVNRREVRDGKMVLGHNPHGELAPYVDVLRVDDADGHMLAVLFSHAAHPVVLGGDSYVVSADFPGHAMETVERVFDGRPVALFAQGCCGNINAMLRGTPAEARALGRMLGGAVIKAAATLQPNLSGPIGSAREVVQLPLQQPPSVEAAEKQLQSAEQVLKDALASRHAGRIRVARRFRDWAHEMLVLAKEGPKDRTRAFEIQALRLGDIAFVGLPGEVFVEYQIWIDKHSPFTSTFVFGYTNGVIGYVPTADAFPKGGYEVETAHKYYPGTLMLTPDCERVIHEAALRVLNKAKGAEQASAP
ncbi:MAG: neutral/alkaline non-lysosomal ceramidase N-terminal domain-containing protein [Planctomycetota bacterium]